MKQNFNTTQKLWLVHSAATWIVMNLRYYAYVLPVSFWMQLKVLIITYIGLQDIASVIWWTVYLPSGTIWERLGVVQVPSSFGIQKAFILY